MSDTKTQIVYTPDTKAIHELGADWQNIVFDIHDYLLSQGFEYDRSLGYIRDGETAEPELIQIGKKIMEIGLGPEYFIDFHLQIISDVINISDLFKRAAEAEENGEEFDIHAALAEAFGVSEEDEE